MQIGTRHTAARTARAAQIAVRLDGEQLAELDLLVRRGAYESRAGALREGLALVWRQWQAAQIAAAYQRGYGERPQEGDDLEAWSQAAGASALAGLEE